MCTHRHFLCKKQTYEKNAEHQRYRTNPEKEKLHAAIWLNTTKTHYIRDLIFFTERQVYALHGVSCSSTISFDQLHASGSNKHA